MKDQVEICLWAHEHRPELFGPLLEAIGKYTPESFVLSQMLEPGNCHENMKKVVERRQPDTRFLLFMDWDARPTVSGWLTTMRNYFESEPLLGSLSAWEPNLAKYGIARPPPGKLFYVRFAACYMQMYDLSRVPIMPDTSIPGGYAMTDLDLCCQVWSNGYRVAMQGDCPAYHMEKVDMSREEAESQGFVQHLPEEFRAQVKWFEKKWGIRYADAFEAVGQNRFLVRMAELSRSRVPGQAVSR